MKSTDFVLIKWMLKEYQWNSGGQTVEQFIKELTERSNKLKVVKKK